MLTLDAVGVVAAASASAGDSSGVWSAEPENNDSDKINKIYNVE